MSDQLHLRRRSRRESGGLNSDLVHLTRVDEVTTPGLSMAAGAKESAHEEKVSLFVVWVPFEETQAIA